MSNRRSWVEPVVWTTLVAGSAGLRLALRDWPNFAPVAALALLAGFWFARRPLLAALIPVAVMVLSDLALGGYELPVLLTVYAALTAPVLLGVLLRRGGRCQPQSNLGVDAASIVGCCLASSVLFFVTTNFAVWACSSTYESSWSGLLHCYTRALPFFRHTWQGDLFYGVILMGSYVVATRLGWASQPTLAKSSTLADTPS